MRSCISDSSEFVLDAAWVPVTWIVLDVFHTYQYSNCRLARLDASLPFSERSSWSKPISPRERAACTGSNSACLDQLWLAIIGVWPFALFVATSVPL